MEVVMLICEDVQIEKSFRRIERNYNRRLAVALANDNMSEIRQVQRDFTGALEYAGTIKSSCVKRTCICCGKPIVGLGLTDFRDAGLSICFDCCTDNNYFNDDIRLINYL